MLEHIGKREIVFWKETEMDDKIAVIYDNAGWQNFTMSGDLARLVKVNLPCSPSPIQRDALILELGAKGLSRRMRQSLPEQPYSEIVLENSSGDERTIYSGLDLRNTMQKSIEISYMPVYLFGSNSVVYQLRVLAEPERRDMVLGQLVSELFEGYIFRVEFPLEVALIEESRLIVLADAGGGGV